MKTYNLLRDHPKFQKAKQLDIVIKENLDLKSFYNLNNPNEYNQLMLRFACEVGDLEMINYFLKDLHLEESNLKENINLTKHEQCKSKDLSTLLEHASGGSEINNSLDDLGYHSLVSTPDRSQSQKSCTNVPLKRQFQSTLIKQTHKDLSQTIKIVNQSKDDSFKQDQHNNKKSYIFNCVAGGSAGLAIASYFVAAAALTSVYASICVFIGMALAGALLGYSIAKLCDKVETKVNNLSAEQHIVKEIAI